MGVAINAHWEESVARNLYLVTPIEPRLLNAGADRRKNECVGQTKKVYVSKKM